ncbi:hypothetical protein L9F63_019578, partial [Diploptera punctata]
KIRKFGAQKTKNARQSSYTFSDLPPRDNNELQERISLISPYYSFLSHSIRICILDNKSIH